MDKEHIRKIEEALSVLKGQPLRRISRAADTVCFQFGQMVEKRAAVRDEQGKWTVGCAMAGEYALHVSCCFRLFCGGRVVAAKSDLYQISSEAMRQLEDGEDIPEDFDYDMVGNNRLDEIIATTLADVSGFQVEQIKVSRLGDLCIRYSNGFGMVVLTDISGGQQCWRFFRQGGEHLVVAGNGIAKEEC